MKSLPATHIRVGEYVFIRTNSKGEPEAEHNKGTGYRLANYPIHAGNCGKCERCAKRREGKR